ncbi:RETICULATA-RELATED 4 protein [Nymphaea thermarum]|nr:RETICULATA-RELATED 4 protein [Nymphaea thermarum]
MSLHEDHLGLVKVESSDFRAVEISTARVACFGRSLRSSCLFRVASTVKRSLRSTSRSTSLCTSSSLVPSQSHQPSHCRIRVKEVATGPSPLHSSAVVFLWLHTGREERRRDRAASATATVAAPSLCYCTVMAIIADFMLVWLPAPTVSLKPPLALSAGPIAKFFHTCPDNAFQRNGLKLFAVIYCMTTKMMSCQKYYVVFEGLERGIYDSWERCQPLVYRYKGAVFKSFDSLEVAENHMYEYVQKKYGVQEKW